MARRLSRKRVSNSNDGGSGARAHVDEREQLHGSAQSLGTWIRAQKSRRGVWETERGKPNYSSADGTRERRA